MWRVALLFHVDRGHEQNALWRRWLALPGSDRFSIYVHASAQQVSPHSFLSDAKLVPWRRSCWMKTQSAKNSLLREALKDREVRFFVHLSQSCVPLCTPEQLLERLGDAQVSRIPKNLLHNEVSSLRRQLEQPVRGRGVRPSPLDTHRLHKHSEWIVLCRKHAQLLVDAEKTPLGKYIIFEWEGVDNENYPLSILDHEGVLEEVKRAPTTYADWYGHAPNAWQWRRQRMVHPYSFGKIHSREIHFLSQVKRRGFLFARKFPGKSDIARHIEQVWLEPL